MDKISPEKRSWTMSRIKGKDTRPELLVRRFLYSQGFRYRVNAKWLPGSPDIVLKKYRTVIFIHGCFWHGHKCLEGRTPKTRTDYWEEKFRKNQERDQRVRRELKERGWNTLIVWECQLNPNLREKTFEEILYWLNHAWLATFEKKEKFYTIEEQTSIAAEPTPSLQK
jgi:DNA mismatch endonuclease (patch repair protein)